MVLLKCIRYYSKNDILKMSSRLILFQIDNIYEFEKISKLDTHTMQLNPRKYLLEKVIIQIRVVVFLFIYR